MSELCQNTILIQNWFASKSFGFGLVTPVAVTLNQMWKAKSCMTTLFLAPLKCGTFGWSDNFLRNLLGFPVFGSGIQTIGKMVQIVHFGHGLDPKGSKNVQTPQLIQTVWHMALWFTQWGPWRPKRVQIVTLDLDWISRSPKGSKLPPVGPKCSTVFVYCTQCLCMFHTKIWHIMLTPCRRELRL